MTENAQYEFASMENAHPGKCQNGNCTLRKMTEKSNLENARIEVAHPGKLQNGKFTTQKMPEWKFNTLENNRKITPQKKTEN